MGRPTYDFEGTTVVITGGSSGIGREIALRFAKAGATVLNGDIDREPKDATTPTDVVIDEQYGDGEYVSTDVTEREDIVELVERAHEFGGVDVMINNAGLQIPKPMSDVTPTEFDRIHGVNSKGTFFGTQVAAADMIDREDPGVIVNTASISSDLAQREQVQYDSSKGSVKMITRGAALEYADDGIRVNGVAPGQIATEFTEGWKDQAEEMVAEDELLKPVPLGRAGTPEDVAGAYLFLASDDGAYVTGELLHVDGGWQVC
ncbi:glucose 1-dehydrogenase [Natronorubrum sp. JWXQ-INN-674]|uniref:Glucose 1-dehydrogenase n=1 Tax=Natronorubrum halalkaliphilum TaxID=2691917 RepID=A0A6B0VGN2_9EURY|nr:SDR family oxidoreductase [Natronorubrum halalkaliphilum]MXV60543.1 glucose 1-dehydrogenase [Natronorubrum halalkaliphilum]